MPSDGTHNVSVREQLHASGTVQNCPKGYHLDLFLQYKGEGRYYSGGNPYSDVKLKGGRWSGIIYIGEAQPLTIWLVCMSPADANLMNSEIADQSGGYPSLVGTPLASVNFTAR